MAVLAGASVLVSCQPSSEHQPGENVSINAVTDPPAPPLAEQHLDREALLLAVVRAASAAALGMDDRDAQRRLDGDPFELRLRFGCAATAGTPEKQSRHWSFDEERRVLRFRVDPDITGDGAAIEPIAGAEFEAVEGFWLRRPWLLAAACPVSRSLNPPLEESQEREKGQQDELEATVTEPRVGVAQFFTGADARTQRRDSRAYEATRTLTKGEAPSPQGYNLVLSGRLRKLFDGRVIACTVSNRDVPPRCIISVQFDRVWIERPDSRETYAEWGSG